MNPSFNIQSPDLDTASSNLFIEAGPMGVSFVIVNDNNCFSAVIVYSFPAGIDNAAIAAEISKIFKDDKYLQQTYKKTTLTWTSTESVLVPNEFMNMAVASTMLDLVHGDIEKGAVRSDFMMKDNMHNVYRIPETVINALPASFQYVNQMHQYSLIPDLMPKHGDRLWVIFYNHRLVVALGKHGCLQVIQNFEYSNAEDAAWHLLNVCESYEANVDDVTLHLSGLIDMDSSLYAALYKYFLKIEMEPQPGNGTCIDAINHHPAHFFSHLFGEALCV